MDTGAAKRGHIGAWLVHMYTASGAVFAFTGAWAVVRGDARLAFGAMLAATVVDATDGALARRADVKEILPDINGAHIDDIVDYLTFVFLPMLLLAASGGLPRLALFPVAAVVLLSSMYGFVAPDAKTADAFFTGFPSYWNIVVLYLLLFHVPPVWNAAILVVLSGMIFVRIGYVYPTRTPTLRVLTLALASVWTVALAAIVVLWPSPPRILAIGSLAFPVYYFVLSLVLHFRRRRGFQHARPEGRAYR
jgi:phosphatidylcholine synthase